MSEVNAEEFMVVNAEKFEAMEVALAALREELARAKSACSKEFESVQTLDNENTALQQRLADAERRNAELVAAMERIRFRCESFYDEADGMKKHSVRTMFDIATRALKPTESGASE